MAHTFVSKSQDNGQSSNPLAIQHTPGSAATVCILSIVVEGNTSRTGGAPTIDGTTATQVGTVQTAVECNIEMWYVCKAFSGSQFDISVPNTNTVTAHLETVTAYAGSGKNSVYHATDALAETGGVDEISLLVDSHEGDFCVGRVGCGENSPDLVSDNGDFYNQPTYYNDHGNYCSLGCYGVSFGLTVSLIWVWSFDDGAAIAADFTDEPGTAQESLSGSFGTNTGNTTRAARYPRAISRAPHEI